MINKDYLVEIGVEELPAAYINNAEKQFKDAFINIGCDFLTETFTNQIFPILNQHQIKELTKKYDFYVWKHINEKASAIRIITSWQTPTDIVDQFIHDINNLK